MNLNLFDLPDFRAQPEPLGAGAMWLRQFALHDERDLLAGLDEVIARAPHPTHGDAGWLCHVGRNEQLRITRLGDR
jgi:hypothetical protein